MQETEAKFYVRDMDKISARLYQLNARLIQERLLETNIRFDLPGNRLRSEGRVLRLRRDTEARLTYKGASANEQGAVSRTEIEFMVEDFEKAKAFLEALGYQQRVYYEKHRTTFELNKTLIMLDELPYGNFVEIEGETVDAIRATAEQLNFIWDAAVAAGYHALFRRLCVTHPELDPSLLTFAALNGLEITAQELSIHAADA